MPTPGHPTPPREGEVVEEMEREWEGLHAGGTAQVQEECNETRYSLLYSVMQVLYVPICTEYI